MLKTRKAHIEKCYYSYHDKNYSKGYIKGINCAIEQLEYNIKQIEK